ncbi:MAG TPA: 3-dehydroquinate synthase [Rhodanobacteraceae bacterium]|nr:3-dehydroquinate synthase [Rhodanobacteraceae bacterium]
MSDSEIEVGLGARRYAIRIGSGILDDAAFWCDAIRGRHILVVSDDNVAPLYAERVREAMEGCGVDPALLALPAGEAHKGLGAVTRVFDALAQLGATRDACVVALGGGVVGDVAGFAAACWMRGIDFIQMPTTLLAMVDSSVGGKTGVDHAAGKNLIGAFHQPRTVVADLDTLATLPDRELRAGFAEVIKTAAIGDAEFFAWLEANAAALLARDQQALTHAVSTCCRFKAGVVARDEREAGERALLNFGHTFGHAVETEAGYGTLLHGEAVAIGMILAARLSVRLGMADEADTQRLRALLQAFDLPTDLPSHLQSDALLVRMRLDKKNRAGTLRLILWRGIGRAEIVESVDEAVVREMLL